MAIYRVKVAGSLLRPAYLKRVRLNLAADGPCTGTATDDAATCK